MQCFETPEEQDLQKQEKIFFKDKLTKKGHCKTEFHSDMFIDPMVSPESYGTSCQTENTFQSSKIDWYNCIKP